MVPGTSSDTPAGVSGAFVAAINAGDLQRALGLYREDAMLLAPDGQCARGRDAIETLLRGLLAMGFEMRTRVERVVEVGDVALAREAWTMRPRTADAAGGEQRGDSLVLFARGPGGWQFLLDAPWGL